MQLRPYQSNLKQAIYAAWAAKHRNTLAILPTGGGKTVVFSNIIHEHRGASVATAHRQELVGQISQALARDGVRHRIIGPKNVIKMCVNAHMVELGRSYYFPSSPCAVAGVDTLVARRDSPELQSWFRSVSLWVQDEAHHLLKKNKWGTAANLFPNAKGLGVTATPTRADGKGLGRHADGVFDAMVQGPGMRDLITAGFLTDYRIFAPPSNLDYSTIKTSQATGEFTRDSVTKAIRKSRVVGDVVAHYKRLAMGKLGVTFAPDVETATTIAAKFNAAGVPAEVVHAKTSDRDRAEALRKFKNRELLQLVNVDLFGEGFDLPSLEVVSMARPTQSYGLYVQQFGRSLRIMDGKTDAIIIDHVGNVMRHGLPDAAREWTLDRRARGRRGTDGGIPVRTCLGCFSVYERIYQVCPFCELRPVPVARCGPEFVDGDLLELDAETLAKMRGDINNVDMDKEEYRGVLAAKYMPLIGQLAHVKRHGLRQEAQRVLRDKIALWAGYQRAKGRPDSESYRRFYYTFGIDVLSAQALGTKGAEKLTVKLGVLL